jgi:hypothetical protein
VFRGTGTSRISIQQSNRHTTGGNTTKSGTRDEAEGKMHQVKGEIKEIAGKVQGKMGQIKKIVGK